MNESVRRSRGGASIYSPSKRIFLVIVLVILVVILAFSYKIFNEKNEEYVKKVQRIEDLEDQIAIENERLKQLKEQENHITNDEGIEAIARQELGLIKRDEIVIRPN